MLDLCPECGKHELIWDGYEHYQGDEGGQCVCQNCGVVVAVTDLTNEDRYQPSNSAPSTAKGRMAYAIRNQVAQFSKGHCEGVKFTERISQCLECGQSMTAEAVALFHRFYMHDLFRLRSMSLKQTLAGCCVYIVCRRHHWPITIVTVAAYTDGGVYAMRSVKNELLANFDDLSDIHPPDLSELVELQCAKTCYSEYVVNTLTKIIPLCRDAWILEGRRPELVISAASYVAWQSEDPKTRGKNSVRNFCTVHRISYSSSIEGIMKEIKSTLVQLAKQIPWIVDGNVSIKNIIWYVSDVLEYRRSLEAEVRTNFLKNVQSDCPTESSVEANNEEIQPPVVEGAVAGKLDHVTVVAGNTTTSASSPSAPCSKSSTATCSPQHRQEVFDPFLPKSFRSPRQRRKRFRPESEEISCSGHPNLDSCELGEDDIREEDMRLYVKSDAELGFSVCEI